MKMLGMLLLVLIPFASPLTAQEVVYAIRTPEEMTLYSFSVKTKETAPLFMDSKSAAKLVERGGASDSVNVIRVVKNRAFAVGKEAGSTAKFGSIYELTLDGSNKATKLFDLETEDFINRLAINRQANLLAYANIKEDTTFKGEGTEQVVSSIVIHELPSGKIVSRIDTKKSIGTNFIGYLGWDVKGESLSYRVEGDRKKEGVFRIAKLNGKPYKLSLKTNAMSSLFDQATTGEYIYSTLSSGMIEFKSETNEIRSKFGFSKDIRGWHYEVSPNDQWLATQTTQGKIWITSRAGDSSQQQVPLKVQGKHSSVTLVGWMP